MNGTVAVTDFGWYDFLASRPHDEVNFWSPSDRRPFRAAVFSPFFFKLKAPYRAIAGFGYYAKWSSLPDWLAWETFGEGNGCESLEEMQLRISGIRRRIRYVAASSEANIGCVLIVQPTFFARDEWISQPVDWRDRTVSTQEYDLTAGEGLRIWEQCLERAAWPAADSHMLPQVAGRLGPRYGSPQMIAPRLGQGTFRVSVMDAYGRACAATSEHSLPALEAVHIRDYAKNGPHEIRNGILLRADLHRLFDTGYLTVTPERQIVISDRLRSDYQNGRSYYPLHGTSLRLPSKTADHPALEFLSWHNDHVFRG